MSRLVRMDGSGHTTLAEWTDADDAAFAEAVREFDSQIELGFIGTVSDGPGKATHVRAAPARGGARDHAPPDRRGLAPWSPRPYPSSRRSTGASRPTRAG